MSAMHLCRGARHTLVAAWTATNLTRQNRAAVPGRPREASSRESGWLARVSAAMRTLVCGMVLVVAPGCAKVDRFAQGAEKPVKLVLLTATVLASALESLGDAEASGRRRRERSKSRSRFSTRATAATGTAMAIDRALPSPRPRR